ncbi:N-acyl homoserine lactonase family protein [soil metagenome]
MTQYEVTTMAVGESIIPGPELFWMNNFEEWFPLTFQSVLIRGNGIVALVNTGPALDLEPMNAGWASFLGEKARLHRGEGEFILDQLAAHDVRPEDVTHVILTPLQLYTVSNVLAFPNAEICIARQGWVHFHTTHDHPHDNRATSIPDEILTELVTTAWPRVRLLENEDEIAEGLRTWWSGGHHRASVVVEADTSQGVVAISDSYFHERNVVDNIPLGINENMYEILACYERVRRTADIILPLYDPANFDRFPHGLVAGK